MIDIHAPPAFFVWLLPVRETDHSPIAESIAQSCRSPATGRKQSLRFSRVYGTMRTTGTYIFRKSSTG